MTRDEVIKLAKEAFESRANREQDNFEEEMALQDAFGEMIDSLPGSLRSKAKKMGVSAAHLSDVARGKRAVTQNIIDRLESL
jgi:hypothetical protein